MSSLDGSWCCGVAWYQGWACVHSALGAWLLQQLPRPPLLISWLHVRGWAAQLHCKLSCTSLQVFPCTDFGQPQRCCGHLLLYAGQWGGTICTSTCVLDNILGGESGLPVMPRAFLAAGHANHIEFQIVSRTLSCKCRKSHCMRESPFLFFFFSDLENVNSQSRPGPVQLTVTNYRLEELQLPMWLSSHVKDPNK